MFSFVPSEPGHPFVQAEVEFEGPNCLRITFTSLTATVDQRSFRQKETFFSARIRSEQRSRAKDKKTGETGIFKQKQTYTKAWTMVLKNASDRKIPFRLEEARPLVRDERITLDLTTTPKPMQEEKPEILAWEGVLAPGTEQKFDVILKFNAPENMELDPGRYW